MDNRPFYELDDDEILIEEAAEAALSHAVTPLATEHTVTPALPLCAPLSAKQASAMTQRFARNTELRLLDHAYLVNMLACTLDVERVDRFGFAAAIKQESAFLLLDDARPNDRPRTDPGLLPRTGLEAIRTATLDYTGRTAQGLGTRLERPALASLGDVENAAHVFFAFRRLSLALVPTLAKSQALTDIVHEYAAHVRVFMNAAAAKFPLLPWPELVAHTDAHTTALARALLEELDKHMEVLDIE